MSEGTILLITHKTGHHAATPMDLFRAVTLLNSRIDLQKTVVAAMDFSKNELRYIKAAVSWPVTVISPDADGLGTRTGT